MAATSLRNFSLFLRPTADQPVLSCSYPCTSVTISNTNKCAHVLLNHHFINTMHITMTATSLRNFSLFWRPTADQPVLSCSYPCTSVTISNTNKCAHILLNHHFINTMPNSDMFQPLKGHLQEVQLIQSSSVGQKNESPAVKFNLLCIVFWVR